MGYTRSTGRIGFVCIRQRGVGRSSLNGAGLGREGLRANSFTRKLGHWSTHRPLSSSFLGLPYRILL